MDEFKASDKENTAELVSRIQAGDRDAETQLIKSYRRGVRAVIRNNGGHSAIDDLSNEVFKIALEKIGKGQVRQPEKLREFLSGVARNLARRYAIKSRLRNETNLEEAEKIPDPAPNPYDQLLQKEKTVFVQWLLDQLPRGRDREVLRRFYCDKDDKEQICADLGLTSSQFNQVLSRARQRFKDLYQKHNWKF